MVDSVIRLFEEDAMDFKSNGIGYLPDATMCTVTEKRNDSFELTMKYPITGRRYNEIGLRKLLVTKSNPYDAPQAFRIYDISRPFNGVVTFNAEHISYDMSGIPINAFESNTLSQAFDKIRQNVILHEFLPFTFWTDVTTDNYFKMDKPNSLRATIGGIDPSLLDIYGGECEFDNYEVKIHKNRGEDRGYSIRYGKNLIDLNHSESLSNIYSSVYPFWYNEDDGFVAPSQKVVPVPGVNIGFEKVYILDCSSDFVDPPTPKQLVDLAKKHINENNLVTPDISLNVSFIALSKTKEYETLKILDKVKLCDTVEVEFEKLGIKTKLKCVETEYNVLTDRYESIALGIPKTTLAKTIVKNKDSASSDLDKSNSNINTVIKNETTRWNLNLHDYQEKTEYTIEQTRSGLHDEIIATSKKITEEYNTSIDITAQGIRADISETRTTLDTRITQEIDDQNAKLEQTTKETREEFNASLEATARGIRADLSEAKTELSNGIETAKIEFYTSIEATARGIRSDLTETRTTLDTRITQEIDDQNAKLEQTTKETREEFNASLEATAREVRSDVSKTYETKTNANKHYEELDSSISQTASDITLSVSKTYETKSNAAEEYGDIRSAIKQSADNITLNVSKTYETKSNAGTVYDELRSSISANADSIELKVSKNGVISAINQTAEKVTISASKININGAISANNTFSVSTDGYATMTGGTIGPFMIGTHRLIGGSSGGYTQLGIAGSNYAFAAGTSATNPSSPNNMAISQNIHIGHNGYVWTNDDIDAEGYMAGDEVYVRQYYNGGAGNRTAIKLTSIGSPRIEFSSISGTSVSYRGRIQVFNDALEVLSNKDLALHSGSSNFIQLYENTKYWGELVANSARKYKDNIYDISEEEGDAVTKLNPVGYVYKRDGRPDFGLIADDTYPILPQIVILDQNGDPDGINYIKLIPFIIRKLKNMEERWNYEHRYGNSEL